MLEQSEAVKKDNDFSARPSQPENVHLQCREEIQSDEMSPEPTHSFIESVTDVDSLIFHVDL